MKRKKQALHSDNHRENKADNCFVDGRIAGAKQGYQPPLRTNDRHTIKCSAIHRPSSGHGPYKQQKHAKGPHGTQKTTEREAGTVQDNHQLSSSQWHEILQASSHPDTSPTGRETPLKTRSSLTWKGPSFQRTPGYCKRSPGSFERTPGSFNLLKDPAHP